MTIPGTLMVSAEKAPEVSVNQLAPVGASHRLQAVEDFDGEGLRGSADGTGLRLAVVCSRFNHRVTALLLNGALAELERLGVTPADRTVAWVPGAFELPLAAMAMARTMRYDAVVCLGAVIRGETSHYDFVAGECASGLQRVQLDLALPVIFGVLTTENLEQALERAGGALGNKGAEAVATAIEMATVLRQLSGSAGLASGAARPQASAPAASPT
jgi:6,7-dimethyl-8-ribityllumazine synthase